MPSAMREAGAGQETSIAILSISRVLDHGGQLVQASVQLTPPHVPGHDAQVLHHQVKHESPHSPVW
jgi:hypothetical protein